MARIPTLDVQLTHMKSLLRTMCDRVLAGLNVLTQHFEHPNADQLIKIVVLDTEVDNLESAVDNAILQIFATQQPLAYELRQAYACAKIAHHIERIGDAVESLARQLAGRHHDSHRDVIEHMLRDAKDLYRRSYAAMFEGDLSQIHEIHALDDKVDAWQKELYSNAREILYAQPGKADVENALQLLNIGTKLEKIADLSCNWAEQIDFAEHGAARRTLKKRKHRIVLMDEHFGHTASLAACFLHQSVRGLVDVSVISRHFGHPLSILNFTDLLTREKITPEVFPLARFETLSWSRCLMFIQLGEFELHEDEKDQIPYKTVRINWPNVSLPQGPLNDVASQATSHQFSKTDLPSLDIVIAAIRERTQQLTQILARTQCDDE